MKKKFFAALSAAVLLFGALTAPAAAETKYRKGDVNRDGEVSVEDAQLALKDYVEYLLGLNDHILDDEQQELADVTDIDNGDPEKRYGRISKVTLDDAVYILQYYTACLSDENLKDTDILTWINNVK